MLKNEEYQSVTVRLGTCWSVGQCVHMPAILVQVL